MMPDDCLRKINDATSIQEGVRACEDLQHWLAIGATEPDWSRWPKGSAAFVRWRRRNGIVNPRVAARE